MELPKILWLKNHMDSSRFHNCQFFDLPDYLTYRATGNNARSACSLTCKCGFLPERDASSGSPSRVANGSQHENIDEEHPKDGGWSPSLLKKVGLAECVENGYKQLGGSKGRKDPDVLTAGMPVGNGLSEQAAKELGLEVGTPVGSAVIDA
jgi:ribulose kinase